MIPIAIADRRTCIAAIVKEARSVSVSAEAYEACDDVDDSDDTDEVDDDVSAKPLRGGRRVGAASSAGGVHVVRRVCWYCFVVRCGALGGDSSGAGLRKAAAGWRLCCRRVWAAATVSSSLPLLLAPLLPVTPRGVVNGTRPGSRGLGDATGGATGRRARADARLVDASSPTSRASRLIQTPSRLGPRPQGARASLEG